MNCIAWWFFFCFCFVQVLSPTCVMVDGIAFLHNWFSKTLFFFPLMFFSFVVIGFLNCLFYAGQTPVSVSLTCGKLRWDHCCAKRTVTLWPPEGTVGISKGTARRMATRWQTQEHACLHTSWVCASLFSSVQLTCCHDTTAWQRTLTCCHGAAVWLWIILQGVGRFVLFIF